MAILTTMIFTQIRTELDNFKISKIVPDLSSGMLQTMMNFLSSKIPKGCRSQAAPEQPAIDRHESELDFVSVRSVVLICLIMLTMVLTNTLSTNVNASKIERKLAIIGIEIALLTLVMPMIIIKRNQNMSKYCLDILKNILKN